jgi:O-antigen biosynthesis protein
MTTPSTAVGAGAATAPGAWHTWRLLHARVGFDPEGLAHQALRTRSPAVLEALARAATNGRDDAGTLLREVLQHGPSPVSLGPRRCAALAATAMVWAGAGRTTDELLGAALAYEQLWAAGAGRQLGPEHHVVAGQALFLSGRHDALEHLLPSLDLPPSVRHYLETDLANPFVERPADRPATAQDADRWPRLLSLPFVDEGLSPLTLRDQEHPGQPLFDRLDARGARPCSAGGPLVTVVMPCFQPDRGLLTSVRSISRQSWADLEIVIVDDASGPHYRELFAEAASLDPRARVLTMERNGGSYLAREAAIAQSTGSLVTFQDADDWSHPSRIEHQVKALDGTTAPMSRSQAVRAKDDLTHQWLGYQPVRDNASSLLVRRRVLEQCGGFVPVRKGADSEFAERVETLAGTIADTGTPLAVTRLRAGSLSRGDFTFSWFAPDRLTFRGAFLAWHRELQERADAGRPLGVSREELHALPFPVPATFVRELPAERHTPTHLDVAYVGNFSTARPSRHARALRQLFEQRPPGPGLVGLWHLEPSWVHPTRRPRMAKPWFDIIQRHPHLRPLSRVEPVHVERMVVVDPAVLSTVAGQPCRVSADRVEVRLAPEHVAPDRSLLPLDLLGTADVCADWWGVRPHWAFAPGLTEDERAQVCEAVPGLPVEETSAP